jgi:hypothetical protein
LPISQQAITNRVLSHDNFYHKGNSEHAEAESKKPQPVTAAVLLVFDVSQPLSRVLCSVARVTIIPLGLKSP